MLYVRFSTAMFDIFAHRVYYYSYRSAIWVQYILRTHPVRYVTENPSNITYPETSILQALAKPQRISHSYTNTTIKRRVKNLDS